jgi:hypothetical protein
MTTGQGGRALLVSFGLMLAFIMHTMPAAGQRQWHQGDTWLKWKHNVREGYVFGYFVAYDQGHKDGCKQGIESAAEKAGSAIVRNSELACSQQDLNFSKGTEFYVKAITDFYVRYPEDREIDIGEVLPLLLKGLTLDEIHNHPFPRHLTPSSNSQH